MMTFIMLCLVIWGVKTGIREYQKAEMRKSNPDTFMRLQEMEQQGRLMKREGIKNAAGFGLTVARMLTGK
jgi:hypothetical protein